MSLLARRAIIAATCALAATACLDSTEPDDSRLTQDEATGLLLGLRSVANLGDETIQPIYASPDSIVLPCPLDGTAKLVGTIEEGEPIEGSATLRTDFQVTPRGCRLESAGFVFTVDGDPSLRDIVDVTINAATFEILIEGTLTGSLAWELEERTGSCAFDLTLSGEPDFSGPQPSFSASYTGTLCGYNVDIDATQFVVPLG